MILLLFISLLNTISGFPDSANPIMVIPPVQDNVEPCKTFTILQANCSSWYQVNSQLLVIPTECNRSMPWSRVILSFTASESGTQYDRFGAVWIGDVEVLRTTTAEPTTNGIVWKTGRDISEYRDYIRTTNDLYTYLTIPNNVDSTYTGVVDVTLELTVYLESFPSESYDPAPTIYPLTNASQDSFPWNVMEVIGNQELSYNINLGDQKVTDAYIEIFASQHGCEEFYYSNVPSDRSSELGICGSGVYREIQVYIDNYLAGTTYPFPTIYTGGINPLLWRPVSGIMSFSISPRRFDISPFINLLTDGQSHTISITVLNNNAEDGGYWYLDATLLLYPNKPSSSSSRLSEESSITSSELYVYDSTAQVNESTVTNLNSKEINITFQTLGYHTYEIMNVVTFTNGSITYRGVRGQLAMINNNSIIGSTTSISTQRTICSTESYARSSGGYFFSKVMLDDFPLYVDSYYDQDATTMDLEGTVYYKYNRINLWRQNDYENNIHSGEVVNILTSLSSSIPNSNSTARKIPLKIFSEQQNSLRKLATGMDSLNGMTTISSRMKLLGMIEIIDEMASKASYNRTLDHATIYDETDISSQGFSILSLATNNRCFDRDVNSSDGYFTEDTTNIDDCDFEYGIYNCEYDICGSLHYLPSSPYKLQHIRENLDDKNQQIDIISFHEVDFTTLSLSELKTTLETLTFGQDNKLGIIHNLDRTFEDHSNRISCQFPRISSSSNNNDHHHYHPRKESVSTILSVRTPRTKFYQKKHRI